MNTYKNDKVNRVLTLYTQLINGHLVNKAQSAIDFGVDERSIQRDIDDIRNFLEINTDDSYFYNTIIYDRDKKGYRLDHIYKMKLTNSEILALCKFYLIAEILPKKKFPQCLIS